MAKTVDSTLDPAKPADLVKLVKALGDASDANIQAAANAAQVQADQDTRIRNIEVPLRFRG